MKHPAFVNCIQLFYLRHTL